MKLRTPMSVEDITAIRRLALMVALVAFVLALTAAAVAGPSPDRDGCAATQQTSFNTQTKETANANPC